MLGIALTDPPTAEDYAQGIKKNQLVMDLNESSWKVCIAYIYFY